MDLSTSYLGFTLPHPLVPGASPLADDLDTVRRLEEAGAPAIVLRSLFEEQINDEAYRQIQDVEAAEETFAEALSYYPRREEYRLSGIDRYLDQIQSIKEVVDIPVIASLNGSTLGGWVDYARNLEEAGADAIELNVYFLSTDPSESAEMVERRVVEILGAVKAGITIPVAVKLSPFFSSLPHLAARLESAGAAGLVIFNRFLQPDIDIEELDVIPRHTLSQKQELLLRLRWLAILSGRVDLSLACTGGVHSATAAIKAVMCGAHVVQLVSILLRDGPERLRTMRQEMAVWLEEHEYESLAQMRGSMSLEHSPDPSAYERGNYIRIIQGGAKYV